MKTLLKRLFYKQRANKVADFYDNWSQRFMTITDTFQGFRTENIAELHDYTIQNAGLSDNDIILDAGCGVGGPALYFAQHLKARIYALTNSKEQVKIINAKKEALGIKNLEVVLGDYHDLPEIFGAGFFTRMLFLESIGHSYHPQKVVSSAFSALKKGGALYIREPFKVQGNSLAVTEEIERIAKMADETFIYNHQPLETLTSHLTKAGFLIEFCRQPDIVPRNILDDEVEKQLGFLIPKGSVSFIECIELKAVKS